MLSEILENEDFDATVFVISSTEKMGSSGKKYITGEVLDKSGKFRYNLWQISNLLNIPNPNTYIKSFGTMIKYKFYANKFTKNISYYR